ncbi:MAG: hypothetical protein IT210_03655 [Armatimonadetes bacterium]|nr:hypothetical protein [Armatimonadota bacterium]
MRFLLIALILLLAAPLMAADLGTMPAANHLKAKEFDVAIYYLEQKSLRRSLCNSKQSISD